MSASGTNFNIDQGDAITVNRHRLKNHIVTSLALQEENANEYAELLSRLNKFQNKYLSILPDVMLPYSSNQFIENAVFPTYIQNKQRPSFLLDLMRALAELTIVAERNVSLDNKPFGDLVLKAFLASAALGSDMVTAMLDDKYRYSVNLRYSSYPGHMFRLIDTVHAISDFVAAPTNQEAIKKLSYATSMLQYYIEPGLTRVLREKPILSALLFTTTALAGIAMIAGSLLLLVSVPSVLLIAAAAVTMAAGFYITLGSSTVLGLQAFQNLETPAAVMAVKERASLARTDYKNLLSGAHTLFHKPVQSQAELEQPHRHQHGMTLSS